MAPRFLAIFSLRDVAGKESTADSHISQLLPSQSKLNNTYTAPYAEIGGHAQTPIAGGCILEKHALMVTFLEVALITALFISHGSALPNG